MRKVITDLFREVDEYYNDPKYFKPAVNIGKFFNISEEKFEDIMHREYKHRIF